MLHSSAWIGVGLTLFCLLAIKKLPHVHADCLAFRQLTAGLICVYGGTFTQFHFAKDFPDSCRRAMNDWAFVSSTKFFHPDKRVAVAWFNHWDWIRAFLTSFIGVQVAEQELRHSLCRSAGSTGAPRPCLIPLSECIFKRTLALSSPFCPCSRSSLTLCNLAQVFQLFRFDMIQLSAIQVPS